MKGDGMGQYVIGLDAGGTKSHLAVFDLSCQLKRFSHWGPLNHESLPGSFTQLEEELTRFVKGELDAVGICPGQIAYAVFGMAGVDNRRQHAVISDIIRRIGLRDFTLCNDAFLSVPAGIPSGIGVCANNGTGYTVVGVNEAGRMLQVGGIGPLSDDRGGGGYIAERMASAVYNFLFRGAEQTILAEMMFDKLGVSDKWDYVDTLSQKVTDEEISLSSWNRFVFEAANQKDRVACGILRDVAASYADSIVCVIHELGFPPDRAVSVVLAGSVFVKGESPLLIDTLREKVEAGSPVKQIMYTLLKEPPVAGAVIWALRTLGVSGNVMDKVCSQF